MKLHITRKKKINILPILFIFVIIIIVIIFIFIKFKKETFFDGHMNIYIICKKDIYLYFEDYINSFIDKIPNSSLVLFTDNNQIPINNGQHKFVFVHRIPDVLIDKLNSSYNNIYVLNTEQLTVKMWYNIINNHPKFIKMIDYNKGNFKYYDNFLYPIKFIEYQINTKEIYNYEKNKGICIIGNIYPYRAPIIEKIKNKGYNVDVINGWNKERDQKLFTYKIIINIDQSEEHKLMEPIRCNRCIFNKMIVVSNKKEDQDLYSLKDYMIFEEYDLLADKVIEVFNNYEIYYKNLGLDTLDLNNLPIDTNVNLE